MANKYAHKDKRIYYNVLNSLKLDQFILGIHTHQLKKNKNSLQEYKLEFINQFAMHIPVTKTYKTIIVALVFLLKSPNLISCKEDAGAEVTDFLHESKYFATNPISGIIFSILMRVFYIKF